MIILLLNNEAIGMKFEIHKNEQEEYLYENDTDKRIIGHSKLKLWIFPWGQGECERPLPL